MAKQLLGKEVVAALNERIIAKAEALKAGSMRYPVHYSGSDTSGEKAYEEFYVESEKVDLARLKALGVIMDKKIPDKNKIQKLFDQLTAAFERVETTKEDIVKIMHEYLPEFQHMEAGKSLDSKM